jgi:hypothetical protein
MKGYAEGSYRIGRCIVWVAIQGKNRNRRNADRMGTSEAYRAYWGVRKKSPRYGSSVGQRFSLPVPTLTLRRCT